MTKSTTDSAYYGQFDGQQNFKLPLKFIDLEVHNGN